MRYARDKHAMGPPCFCDACYKPSEGLHQVGGPCPREGCHGTLQHRGCWVYWRFGYTDFEATPKEDLTEEDVAAINAAHAERRR